ncbi:MAG: L-seryl-tRNA(Sec) selenium transferase [Bacillota bacterium]
MSDNPLRNLPSVWRVLEHPSVRSAGDFSRNVVLHVAREQLAKAREAIARGEPAPQLDEIASRVGAKLGELAGGMTKVINAAGIIIHTNLGRSPLAPSAVRAVGEAANSYVDLEIDMDAGERGNRTGRVEEQLSALTGAEAATVVNNNAAAVLLVLAALARGREVLVSRGELVEIGGSFRVPEVMEQSGARLKEVGTTNRTRADDYRRHITPETGALLKVHTSNYRIIGFTQDVSYRELCAIGREAGLFVIADLGSGMLLDPGEFGLPSEPTVHSVLGDGVDIVCFSGDKMLGGPQCGIILGKKELVRRCAQHPLYRALRVDKITLAALGATLALYLRSSAVSELPIYRTMSVSPGELRERAERLAARLGAMGLAARAEADVSEVGGGAFPGAGLESYSVLVRPRCSAGEAAARLRRQRPAVLCKLRQDTLMFDLRCVMPEEEEALLCCIRGACM